jgi:hypothetical protein
MLLEKISAACEGLEDSRSLRNQKHPFLSVIGNSFSGMADFAQCHLDDLSKLFPLPHGAPSHDTFQRIFDALSPRAFLECFALFTEHLATAVKGLNVLDEKTIRHSSKNGNNLYIVSAWCDENRLVLGHVATHSAAGSELTAMKQVLSLLDLAGRTISVDA